MEKRSVVINPGHAPIPRKLVMKITDGHFLDLADLLSANLRARGKRTQTFLDGFLVVSAPKRRVVEVLDILTWTETLSMY